MIFYKKIKEIIDKKWQKVGIYSPFMKIEGKTVILIKDKDNLNFESKYIDMDVMPLS